MPAHVKPSLTLREAWALIRAADNVMGHADAVESVFPDPVDRQAARRAMLKLEAAWSAKVNDR